MHVLYMQMTYHPFYNCNEILNLQALRLKFVSQGLIFTNISSMNYQNIEMFQSPTKNCTVTKHTCILPLRFGILLLTLIIHTLTCLTSILVMYVSVSRTGCSTAWYSTYRWGYRINNNSAIIPAFICVERYLRFYKSTLTLSILY